MRLAGSGVRELVDAHYDSLYRYAYRLAGSAVEAEDLTQEAFGKALARLPQLRDPAKAKSWLFRILRNAYLHRLRDERRHKTVSLDGIGELPADPPDEPPEIDPARLQEALNELDEGFRTPLILFYFEDFSYRDIADQMDLPIGTVMSRLARAKVYLRAKLAPHTDPAGVGPRRGSDGV
jgi:RNA polymerase sigma-70 factor (ECF subfamily)